MMAVLNIIVNNEKGAIHLFYHDVFKYEETSYETFTIANPS